MSERNYGLTHLMENVAETHWPRRKTWLASLAFLAVLFVGGYFVARIVGWL